MNRETILNEVKLNSNSLINYQEYNNDEEIVLKILNTLLKSSNLNSQRVKLYNDFAKSLTTSKSSINQKKIFLYQIISKLINDFKKDNSLDRDNVKYISKGSVKTLSKQETYNYFNEETWDPFNVPQKYWR